MFLLVVAAVVLLRPGPALATPVSQWHPLFEKNLGQTADVVEYLARTDSYQLFLTEAGAVISVVDLNGSPPASMQVQFVGGDGHAKLLEKLVGTDAVGGHANYFVGRGSGPKVSEAPMFRRVVAPDVYDGIDVEFYGTQQGELEFDFVVSANADPGQIGIRFATSSAVTIDRRGDLLLPADGHVLTQRAPIVYQVIDDDRLEIASRYQIDTTGVVRIEVGEYDRAQPLIIDPIVEYSTYLSEPNMSSAEHMVADASGNTYVTGFTTSLSFPGGEGYQPDNAGGGDAYVMKFSPDGQELIYATYLGGSGSEADGGAIGPTLAVDRAGNAIVTGRTNSADFPLVNPLQGTLEGEFDFYVAKLNRQGSELLFSTYLGGPAEGAGMPPEEAAPTLALDATGNIYLIGYSSANTFPMVNPIQAENAGGLEGILAKLDSRGSELLFSTYFGGSSDDKPRGLTVDYSGNVIVTGRTDSLDFPVTPDAYQSDQAGRGDAFVLKVDSEGTEILYGTYFGGENTDKGRAVITDDFGNIFITGNTQSRDFPVTDMVPQSTLHGSGDAFVTKIDSTGTLLYFSTYLGGTEADLGAGLALGRRGALYVTGYTESTNFPVRIPFQETFGGSRDAFLTALNRNTGNLISSSYLGGSGDDDGIAVGVDRQNVAYVFGETTSQDFLVLNAYQSEIGDLFITKILPR